MYNTYFDLYHELIISDLLLILHLRMDITAEAYFQV